MTKTSSPFLNNLLMPPTKKKKNKFIFPSQTIGSCLPPSQDLIILFFFSSPPSPNLQESFVAMDSPPNTPTFPPMPTPCGFTKLLENMELQRSSNLDSREDEIEDFTPTEVTHTPASECMTLQVPICWFFEFFCPRFRSPYIR